jgi:membrane protease YdiL (CAAX protease family)
MTEVCHWSIRQAMIAFALLVMVSGLLSLGVFGLVDDPSQALNPKNPVVLMAMIVATMFGMGASLVYGFKVAGRSAFRLGPVDLEYLVFAAALTLPVLGFGHAWTWAIEAMGVQVQPQTFVRGMFETPSTQAVVVAVVYGVFGAAILEELLFRGFIQPPFVSHFGPVAGVLLAAFVFGLVHASDPFAVIPTMVIGAVAGWLRHKTGGLGASMLFHGLNNAFALILTALA